MGGGDLLLVPRPRHLELHRGGAGGAAPESPVREQQIAGLPAEGFEIDITGEAVDVRHGDAAGRRYARSTLDQIRRQSPGRLPALSIRDWPDFPVRGYLLDISRDRVPTRETLERLVGLMALVRINQFQLYTEHTFAYRDHEVVWRHASPITADDVRGLDQLCRDHGIELVPNQNCFGHMGRWLQHDAYRHRAESPGGFELMPGVSLPPGVLAPTEDNATFVLGLLDELLANFTSRRVNVGCDETFELGQGVSRDDVARRGRTRVYAEHLERIVRPLVERGYEVQFWADVIRREPAAAGLLPGGAVAVAWTYEAPRPEADRPALSPLLVRSLADLGVDQEVFDGFGPNVAPVADTGFPFWVAPGTSSWNSLVGRIDNAMGNLIDAAEVGLERSAGGYLVTDWGDNGHLQPPSVSFGPLVFGGAVSWALEANRDLDLPEVLDAFVFGDTTRTLGGVLDGVGRVWARTGQMAYNASPLQAALMPAQLHLVTGAPDKARTAEVVGQLDEAIAAVHRAAPACPDGEIVAAELAAAARLARHGAWRLSAGAGGAAPSTAELRVDLREAIAEQEACWLRRSRPGGRADSLAHLRSTLAGYG